MGDIVFIAILALCMIIGMKRGFARSLISVLSTVASVFCGLFLYVPVSKAIINSELGKVISENVNNILEKTISEKTGTIGEAIINMPDASNALTSLTTNAIAFVVSVLIIKIIVSVAMAVLNLTVKLPVIKQLNGLIGGALGLLSGIIICYIIVGVSETVEPGGSFVWLTNIVKSSELASVMKNGNIVTEILSDFIKNK